MSSADTPAHRAASLLAAETESVARAVTTALYAESADVLACHGEIGREKCLQDMRYNIEHLVPAVGLEDPAMFAAYVSWLDELLARRGVDRVHLRRCLGLLGDEARARLAPDEHAAVHAALRAGLATLEAGGASSSGAEAAATPGGRT